MPLHLPWYRGCTSFISLLSFTNLTSILFHWQQWSRRGCVCPLGQCWASPLLGILWWWRGNWGWKCQQCPVSSAKDGQVNGSRKYLLVGLANQEGLALPRGKRKGSVSAEPLFDDFFQQCCTPTSPCAHSKIYLTQSYGPDALNPSTPKQDEPGQPFPAPTVANLGKSTSPVLLNSAPTSSNFFQVHLEFLCTWDWLQVGQRGSWTSVTASKHLPGERGAYSDKLQLSRAQCEAVVLPGAGDYHKVKNEQTAYNDFLHMTKLGQEKQTSTAPNWFQPNPIGQSGLNTIFIQYF